MKEVYNYQEIGTLIDQGKQVVFTCHPAARVTAVQKSADSDTITATITLLIGEYVISVMESEYASIVALLDAFDIDESSEIWEMLE